MIYFSPYYNEKWDTANPCNFDSQNICSVGQVTLEALNMIGVYHTIHINCHNIPGLHIRTYFVSIKSADLDLFTEQTHQRTDIISLKELYY